MTRTLSLLAAGLVGGGVAAGALVASGATSGTNTTTVERTLAAAAAAAPVSRTTSGLDPATIYARAAPGVVDITARGTQTQPNQGFPFGPSGGQTVDTGTGFFIDGGGRILTAAHVVDGARSIQIRLKSGTTRTATLVGEDRSTDVAVLKINASGLNLTALPLGDSTRLRVGDAVLAIGDPFGYDRSLSTGVVSGLARSVDAPNGFSIANAIQTDAVLNPGNSGGPVLDSSGDVIGIADQVVSGGQGGTSDSAGNSGIGFAVPISVAKASAQQLERSGKAAHAYLGVATSSETANGNPIDGALVGQVQPGTPAAKAGIRKGDIIDRVNGRPISDSTALVAVVQSAQPGDHITLGIRRGGRQISVPVTLGKQPAQAPPTG